MIAWGWKHGSLLVFGWRKSLWFLLGVNVVVVYRCFCFAEWFFAPTEFYTPSSWLSSLWFHRQCNIAFQHSRSRHHESQFTLLDNLIDGILILEGLFHI